MAVIEDDKEEFIPRGNVFVPGERIKRRPISLN